MKSPLLLSIFILTITTLLSPALQLVPNRKTSLLVSPLAMEISPNERISAAYNSTHVGIYNALTGAQMDLLRPQSRTVSMEFSANSRLLALSSADGNTMIYQVEKDKIALVKQFRYKGQEVRRENESVIADTCFTANDEFLVIAHTDGIIIAWTLEGLVATGFFPTSKPTKIACFSTLESQFAIASLTSTSNLPVLQAFTIDSQTLAIESEAIAFDLGNLTRINYLVIQGDEVYAVGDLGFVYRYVLPDYKMEIFYESVGELYKIQFGKNGNIFGLINSTHVIVNQNIKMDKRMLGQDNWTTTYFQTNRKMFSLATQGTRLIYLEQNGQAKYLDSCPQGQYTNALNQCTSCQSECSLCHRDPTLCFQCKSNHFLLQQTCIQCPPDCQQCLNSTTCTSCRDPNANIETHCQCNRGYILKDTFCQRGVEFWVWGVTVGSATLVLVVIVVLHVVLLGRKADKNGLLEDGGE